MRQKTISRIEKWSLKVFLVCMLVCAVAFIALIWTQTEPEWVPIIPTLFIVGLASFLIWLPIVMYKIVDALKHR